MAKDKKNKGQRGGGQLEQGIVTDPRFARMHNDPRFRKFPKNANKVEIDERFKGMMRWFACTRRHVHHHGAPPYPPQNAGMFEDADFQGVAVVDKRGRKVAPSRRKGQDLKRYYRLKDEVWGWGWGWGWGEDYVGEYKPVVLLVCIPYAHSASMMLPRMSHAIIKCTFHDTG